MAITQVAAQVTTKRAYNIVSSGQALMRSVYYSRQTSSTFLWQKQKEVFSMMRSVSRRWSSSGSAAEESSSVSETTTTTTTTSSSSAPPAVDADIKSYGGVQDDPHKVASDTHGEHDKRGDDQESISSVGYDMSKVSKPAGGE